MKIVSEARTVLPSSRTMTGLGWAPTEDDEEEEDERRRSTDNDDDDDEEDEYDKRVKEAHASGEFCLSECLASVAIK